MAEKYLNLPDIISFGIFDSNLRYKDKDYSPHRTVALFELELPLECDGECYFDKTAYKPDTDTFFIGKPGMLRYSKLHYKCYYIHLLCEKGFFFDLLCSFPTSLPLENSEKAAEIMKSLISANGTPTEKNKLVSCYNLLELFTILEGESEKYNRTVHASSDAGDVINSALTFINLNFRSPITLNDVANHVHLSRIYFHNLFVKGVGQTVHKYIQSKRIDEAKRMLLLTDEPMVSVALGSGFSSQSYFNYVFKKEVGVPPQVYRKAASMKY